MDSEVEKKLGKNPQWVTDTFGGKKEKSACRDALGKLRVASKGQR